MSTEVSCSGELEKVIAPKGTIQAAHDTESNCGYQSRLTRNKMAETEDQENIPETEGAATKASSSSSDECVSLTVVHNRHRYDLTFPINSTVLSMKERLESLTNVAGGEDHVGGFAMTAEAELAFRQEALFQMVPLKADIYFCSDDVRL
nr:unnamed protein product [Spirometra erinaceieuropaei]